MRIFERLSRRLAITLAGVMACSAFAVPVAPALTAFAAEGEQPAEVKENDKGNGVPSFPEDYASWEASATLIKAGSDWDYADATFDYWGSEGEGDKKVDYYLETFKINAPVDGKLQIHVDSTATVNIGVWKKGDTQEASIDATAGEAEKLAGKVDLFGEAKEIAAGEYYMVIITKDKDSKFRVKPELIANIKNTKVKVSSSDKKTVKATIKKAKKVDGYQFAYGTKKEINDKTKYKSVKAKKVKFDKDKNGSYTIKKLKSGKVYWVRVRTYVVKDGVKYYSDWSAVKKVKVK